MYNYRVDISVKPSVPIDFPNIQGAFGGVALRQRTQPATTCLEVLQHAYQNWTDLSNKFKDDPNLTPHPDKETGKYSSVSIADTQAAWTVLVNSEVFQNFTREMDCLRTGSCLTSRQPCAFSGEQQQTYEGLQKGQVRLQQLGAKITAEHVIRSAASLQPGVDNEVTIVVSERFQNQPTLNGEQTFKCTLQVNVLSLSAGPLFSALAFRQYTVVRQPTVTNGQPPSNGFNSLAVENRSGLQPLGAALLNYEIPGLKGLKRIQDVFGFTISTGPTFRIGGSSEASSFGYFGGIAIHLWNRFYITPGVHVGEFADFPPGFVEHSVVPDGFSQLTPVKRWTAKFGVGVTYRTNTFSGINFGAARTVTPGTPTPSSQTPSSAASGGKGATGGGTGGTPPPENPK